MSKKIGIPIGIIVAAALVLCLVPLKTVAYTVMADYQDTETYYENEPYEVPLDYDVTKSYVDKDTRLERHRIIIGGEVLQDEIVEVSSPIGCVMVQNIANVSGTFNVGFSFYALDKFEAELFKEGRTESEFKEYMKIVGEKYNSNKNLNLESGEAGTAKYNAYDINMDEDEWFWEYEVTPGTKTEYNQVEKQRTVTKQRSETCYKKVTLLDYLLHY
jgi:hypothetical protein